MRTRALLVVVFAALLAGIAPGPAGADSNTRPFKATVVGERGLTPTSFVGTGVATHLGTFEFQGEREFGPFDSQLCAPFLSLELTFTAANGDELYIVGTGGDNCVISIDGSIVELEANVEVVFGGGTGGFADASGQATAWFDITVDNSVGSVTFVGGYEGTIGY
jgi:hypothetical protein